MKRRAWVPAMEAIAILKERNVDPLEALVALIRETGWSGLNRLWALANPVVVRDGMTSWLTSPQVDVERGTLVVPTRASGRRLPEDRAVPILINPHEIDRRWPGQASGRRGGRPRNYDREAFEDALRLEIQARGFPSPENEADWQTKADVQRWAAGFLDDRKEALGDTQLKRLVSDALSNLQTAEQSET